VIDNRCGFKPSASLTLSAKRILREEAFPCRTPSGIIVGIPVMMDIESGEVGHPRSEATLDWINTYSGGQHRSRQTAPIYECSIISFPFKAVTWSNFDQVG